MDLNKNPLEISSFIYFILFSSKLYLMYNNYFILFIEKIKERKKPI